MIGRIVCSFRVKTFSENVLSASGRGVGSRLWHYELTLLQLPYRTLCHDRKAREIQFACRFRVPNMADPQEAETVVLRSNDRFGGELGQRRGIFRARSSGAMVVAAISVFFAIVQLKGYTATRWLHMLLKMTRIADITNNPTKFPRPPYTIFSTRVVLPSHLTKPVYISINAGGKITRVTSSPFAALLDSRVIVDVSPLVVMPGLIDPHVHCNEPGRTTWEGFESATKAAAAGGTTTILDMPLNNVPSTTNRNTFGQKVKALISAQPTTDVGLIGGVVPENAGNISELISSGVIALKSFMVDSQSTDFPNVSKEDLRLAIQNLHDSASESQRGGHLLPYILHAELDTNSQNSRQQGYDHESYADYEASRPASWEIAAVELALKTANNSNVHIHVAHVAASEVAHLVSEMRQSGGLNVASVSAETCPHYLLWAKEDIPRGAVSFKCAPPIRSEHNRRALLSSTLDRSGKSGIDLVASDHSPCPPELKSMNGNMTESWGGIAGLQYRLQGTWTAASQITNDVTIIAELLAEGPAKVFGLDDIKGFLKVGLDADIVVWNPEASEDLSEERCLHRHKKSPFHATRAKGVVIHTLLRGELVFSRIAEKRSGGKRGSDSSWTAGRLLVRSQLHGSVHGIDPNDWKSGSFDLKEY